MCQFPSLAFDTEMPEIQTSTSLVGLMLLENALAGGEEALSMDDNGDAMTELPDPSILETSIEPIHSSTHDNAAADHEPYNPLKRTFSLTQTSIFPTDHANIEAHNSQSQFEDWAPQVWEEMICNESFKRQKVTPSPTHEPESVGSSQPENKSQASASKDAPEPASVRFSRIPITFMAPSVLASVVSPSSNTGGQRDKPHQIARKNNSGIDPQGALNQILWQRGVVPAGLRIKAQASTYDTTPTPYQLASFGPELIKNIQEENIENLRALFQAGVSPNACNQFRDSVVDLVCKQGNQTAFSVLVEHGCDLKVCDGFGRTPLHHCCWSTTFNPKIACYVLSADPQQLFMEDHNGRTPLEYVRPNREFDWIDFLQRERDALFPPGVPIPNPKRQTRKRLPNPKNALPIRLVEAVVSGALSPQEALLRKKP